MPGRKPQPTNDKLHRLLFIRGGTSPMADANSQVEVIEHLSSEIAAQTDYLAQLRSRVALTILIGPFVVFGSFLVATKGIQVPLHLGKLQLTVGVLASAAYLALGWYGALLDRQVTNQCDRWRCSILKISVSKALKE